MADIGLEAVDGQDDAALGRRRGPSRWGSAVDRALSSS